MQEAEEELHHRLLLRLRLAFLVHDFGIAHRRREGIDCTGYLTDFDAPSNNLSMHGYTYGAVGHRGVPTRAEAVWRLRGDLPLLALNVELLACLRHKPPYLVFVGYSH